MGHLLVRNAFSGCSFNNFTLSATGAKRLFGTIPSEVGKQKKKYQITSHETTSNYITWKYYWRALISMGRISSYHIILPHQRLEPCDITLNDWELKGYRKLLLEIVGKISIFALIEDWQKELVFLFASDWISSLSNEVIHSFQRAAEIGVELKEPWLVCNAAVYLWNYTTHMLSQGRHKEIIPIYSPVLEAMKVTGHAR